MGFDWQTEDDNWEVDPPTPPVAAGRTRRFPLMIVGALMLLLSGAFLYWQVNRIITQSSDNIAAEVRAADTLAEDAAQRRDVDLFTTLLSGRDPEWVQTHQGLVAEGLFTERHPLGLITAPDASRLVTVTVAPDLRVAEREALRTYVVAGADGKPEPFQLKDVAQYRLGERRWLLSPPDEEYWGRWQVAQGNYLMLTFRARDEGLARRLLQDLDQLVLELCNEPAPHDCPSSRFLWVRFNPDPATLLEIADPLTLLETGRRLNLPSPSIVGLPQDERGYQALYRGYARYVAGQVIARRAHWRCCRAEGDYFGAAFYQALLERHLHALGLQEWTLMHTDLTPLLRQPLDLTGLRTIWETPIERVTTSERRWFAYAAVDFLLKQSPDLSLWELEHDLVRADRFLRWYGSRMPGGLGASANQEWLTYLEELPRAGDAEIRQEAVLAYCDGAVQVLRPGTSQWERTGAARSYPLVGRFYPLPDKNGVIVQTYNGSGSNTTYLWQAERLIELRLEGSEVGRWAFQGQQSPDGETLILANLAGGASRFAAVNLRDCLGGGCTLQTLPAPPIWSPDGLHTLLVIDSTIYLADWAGQTQRALTEGRWPFWINDITIGFTTLEEAQPALHKLDIATGTVVRLVQQEAWATIMPEGKTLRGYELVHTAGAVAPGTPFFLGFMDLQGGTESALIALSPEDGEVRLQALLPGWVSQLSYSPAGTTLGVASFLLEGSADTSLHLVDPATGQERRLSGRFNTWLPYNTGVPRWSADGNALLFSQLPGQFTVADLAGERIDWLVHDFSICTDYAWAGGS